MIKASVIIPVRNEEKHIRKCLESVLENDYPKDAYEVVIIDGCSSDDTVRIIEDLGWRDLRYRVLSNEKRIVPVSMNMGIQEALGAYIIRMDAHTVYEADYIRKCVEYLDAGIAHNVGGPMRPVSDTLVGTAISLATCSKFGVGNSSFHFENYKGYADSVYLGAYKKEVFDEIGLFDEDLIRNQDDELNFRLVRGGFKIYLTPEIRSSYYPRSSLLSLWKQYYQYGFWKVRVIQKHWRIASWRHLVPPIFSLALMSLVGGSLVWPSFLSLLVPLTVLYLGGCVIAIIALKGKSVRVNFLLPIVFLILHVSYGTGFLHGLLSFPLESRESIFD
jgi:glycosyltransferase involved in cell wall biosynthesis